MFPRKSNSVQSLSVETLGFREKCAKMEENSEDKD